LSVHGNVHWSEYSYGVLVVVAGSNYHFDLHICFDSPTAWNYSFALSPLASMIMGLLVLILLVGTLMLIGSVAVFQTCLVLTNQITYEQIRLPTDVSTWPWYFRYLTIGRFEPTGQPKPVFLPDDHPPTNCGSDYRPFDQGILANVKDFVFIAAKSFKLRNRGLIERWNLNSPLVDENVKEIRNRGKGKAKSLDGTYEWQPAEDGCVAQLYIDELEDRLIPDSFMDRLRRDAGLAL
jgi:hypothetical protein